MIVTAIPNQTRTFTAPSERSKSGSHRRVTFGAMPSMTQPIDATPLVISSLLGAPKSAGRNSASVMPFTQHLALAYQRPDSSPSRLSRSSSAPSSSTFSSPRFSPGRRHSFRTSSAGHYLSRAVSSGRQSRARSQTPAQGLSRTPVPQFVTQTPLKHPTNTHTGTLPPTSASPQMRSQTQHPMTTTSARRLGAELYPTLRRSDLDREKALFRSGVGLIGELFSETSRSQSARWKAMAPRGMDSQGGGDSFCRASRAEAQLNNADFAKVYHVVPQRVVSARTSSRHGVNVNLQQLNQSICHRRHTFNRGITNSILYTNGNISTVHNSGVMATPNSPEPDVTKQERGQRSLRSSEGQRDFKKSSDMENSREITSAKETVNDLSSSEEVQKTIGSPRYRDENRTSTQTTGEKLTSSAKGKMGSRSTQSFERNLSFRQSSRAKEEPKASVVTKRSLSSPGNYQRDSTSREMSRSIPQHSIRGVGSLEHSMEWLEETKMKQEESVAILSEQLQSMIPNQQQEHLVVNPTEVNSSEKAVSDPNDASTMSLIPHSPEDGYKDDEETEDDSKSTERVKCMKTMQCEVLGPYSCSDCTKIRLHERQHQEQTSLYPDLIVDPRTLVAPERLKRLTASLPPRLTSQRHTLDCGCSVKMHSDFLFPVIVTDHDIHTRLKTQRAASAYKEIRAQSSLAESEDRVALPAALASGELSSSKGEREKRRAGKDKDLSCDVEEEEEKEEVSMSPTDMKVTVRYTTPSPEQKSVFLTH